MPLTNSDRDALYKEIEQEDAKGDKADSAKILEISNYLAKDKASQKEADQGTVYGASTAVKPPAQAPQPLYDPENRAYTRDIPGTGASWDAQDLAKRGVDIYSGAPAGNLKAGLAPNIESRIKVYEDALSKQFGKQTKVFQDAKSGQLLYTDPSGKVKLIADGAGSTAGGRLARGVVPVSEAAASAAGAMIGGEVGFPTVGASLASSAVEGAKLGIGKMIGADSAANTVQQTNPTTGQKEFVSKPYSPMQVLLDSSKAGIQTALSMAPVLALAKLPGLISFFFKGQAPFNPKYAEDLMNKAAESDQLVAKVKALGPGAENYNPLVSQMANDPKALRYQDYVTGNPDVNANISQVMQGTQNSLKAGFNNVTNKGMVPGMVGVEGSQATLDGIKLAQADAQTRTMETIKNAQGALGVLVKGLPTATRAELAQGVGPAIVEKNESMQEAARQAYSVSDLGSHQTSPIPREAFGTPAGLDWKYAVTKIREQILGGLTYEERQAFSGMNPRLPNPQATVDELLQKSLGIVPKFDEGMPVWALNDHIKFLNDKIRDVTQGKATAGTDAYKLYSMKNTAARFRADFLRSNNPQLLNDVEKAEAASRAQHEFEDNMIAYGFMKPSANKTGLDPRTQMLAGITNNGDKAAAKQLMEAIKDNPNALSTTENYALSMYKDMFSTKADGVVSMTPDRFEKFTRKKAETLKLLMSPEAQKAIETGGNLQKIVMENTVKFKAAEETFNKSFEGGLTSMTAEGLTNSIFNDSLGVEGIQKLVNVSKTLGTYEAQKSSTLLKMRDMVMGQDGKSFSPDALARIVNDSQAMAKATAWFGSEYTRNLKTIHDGIELAGRTSTSGAAAVNERNRFTDLGRVFWAKPLTAEGRALTLLTGLRKDAFSRAISEGLSNPESFRNLVMLSGMRKDSKQAMDLAASLGASALAGPDYYGEVGEHADEPQKPKWSLTSK